MARTRASRPPFRELLGPDAFSGQAVEVRRLDLLLPIPFDDHGEMEVDLLDANAHLAIELDSPQHLGNPDACRRDRRKDALLQEHGYFVLRFLAEDVSQQLDRVLDAVLHIMLRRGRG